MNVYSAYHSKAIYALATPVFISVMFVLPMAVQGLSLEANEMCVPVKQECGCGKVMGKHGCKAGNNKFMCDCWDDTQGFRTMGKCVATFKCKALSNSDGTFDPAQKLLSDVLKQLMDKLMQGGGGGGGWTSPPGFEGCTQYFQTSDISRLSDPCAQYVPDVSAGIDVTLDPVSGIINPAIIVPATTGATGTAPTTPRASPPLRTIFQPNLGGLNGPAVGLRGDILTRFRDATIIAGFRDEERNVEISGFLGSETSSGQQSTSLVARWCQSRPWSSNFLSKIATSAFFDNLCKARGYQVGFATSTTSQVTLVQRSTVIRATSTTPATSTPSVQPQVDIWASPPSVPLGGRTSIFWSAQGVLSCVEKASDGNFNHQSLSGGAATVPITEAVTFTITCSVSDGSTISGSVVVGLKI